MFEELLVAILNISQVLLSFDLHMLNDTLNVLFKLIDYHKWDAASQGPLYSSNKESLRFLSSFLANSAVGLCSLWFSGLCILITHLPSFHPSTPVQWLSDVLFTIPEAALVLHRRAQAVQYAPLENRAAGRPAK